MKILDVGCGKRKFKSDNPLDNVTGIDLVKTPDADVVWNLERRPWPFKEEEFDFVRCNHVLEHLSDTVKTMEELWRIMKKGSKLRIVVPYHTSPGANTDPTHKVNFAYRSLDYFTRSQKIYDFYTPRSFSLVSRRLFFHKTAKIFESFFNRFPRFYERVFRYLIPAEEIHFVLRKDDA